MMGRGGFGMPPRPGFPVFNPYAPGGPPYAPHPGRPPLPGRPPHHHGRLHDRRGGGDGGSRRDEERNERPPPDSTKDPGGEGGEGGTIMNNGPLAPSSAAARSTSSSPLHGKTELEFVLPGKIKYLSWSATGRLLACGRPGGDLRIIDTEVDNPKSAAPSIKLSGATGGVCVFDPANANVLSTAAGDGTLKLWDLRTQKCTGTISTATETINSAMSPDGNTLCLSNSREQVSFIDLRTHKSKTFNFGKQHDVNAICWNKDGSHFLMATARYSNDTSCSGVEVYSWAYPGITPVGSVKGHSSGCMSVATDPTGKYFASGGTDALVCLYDYRSRICLWTMSDFLSQVLTVSFSHDGKYLAAGSSNMSREMGTSGECALEIAEVASGKSVHVASSKESVYKLVWSPKDSYSLARSIEHVVGYRGQVEVMSNIKIWL